MKMFLLGVLATLSILSLLALGGPAPQDKDSRLPAVMGPGTAMFSLTVIKGTGAGFPGLSPMTPVNILEMDGDWALVGYEDQVGGTAWLNLNTVISFQPRN